MSPKRRRNSSQPASGEGTEKSGERLQKVLAAAGVASRRECEELILAGRVEVDRETVTVLGTRVDPQRQEIRVDGTPLARPRHVYYVLNKPTGVVSTNRDPDARTRVIDLVPSEKRLFTIGRLDRSSEGMIIVTNDGDLANQLTHPRYGVPKTYRARVAGFPTAETLQQLRQGVHLAEGLARVSSLKVRGRHAKGVELEIVLTEGRNREIRRILAKVGHKVQHLRRTAIGPVKLGRLQVGEFRSLTLDEIRLLRQAVQSQTESGGSRGRKKKAVSQRSRTVRSSQGASRAGRGASGRTSAASGDARGKRTKPKVKKKQATGLPKKKGGKRTAKEGTVLDYEPSLPSEGKKRTATKRGKPTKKRGSAKKSRRKGKRR